MRQYSNKRDKNERPIIDALKQVGCTVQELSAPGVPDLLVGYVDDRGKKSMVLMEVKNKHGKRTGQQIEWTLWWGGPAPAIVRSIEDALRVIGRIE